MVHKRYAKIGVLFLFLQTESETIKQYSFNNNLKTIIPTTLHIYNCSNSLIVYHASIDALDASIDALSCKSLARLTPDCVH